MDYSIRWQLIEEIGKGGQGAVHKSISTKEIQEQNTLAKQIVQKLPQNYRDYEKGKEFVNLLTDFVDKKNKTNFKAIKILQTIDPRNKDKQKERIKNEINVLNKIKHKNIIKIIDSDDEYGWFVSEYYSNGTLDLKLSNFSGRFIDSLKTIRPIVEAVASLHEKGVVHRDIKPKNVFIDNENNLILGDFGLVFFIDGVDERLSGTYENVGTHAWMPPWAMEIRNDEVRPTFDVFSLGKIIYSMVSKKPVLPLWYFNRTDYNVELMYPNAKYIRLANELFRKCIVEKEGDCLKNASDLVNEINHIISICDDDRDWNNQNVLKHCLCCTEGVYLKTEKAYMGQHGIKVYDLATYKCNTCGNIQLFSEKATQ